MKIQSFKDLIVWQKSIKLVKRVYIITREFPSSEAYGLTSQMRRAAVSIPSNIAEGYRRQALGEYLQFLYIANASLAELETQIIIAKDIYSRLDYQGAEDLVLEIEKMLYSLIYKLKQHRNIKIS